MADNNFTVKRKRLVIVIACVAVVAIAVLSGWAIKNNAVKDRRVIIAEITCRNPSTKGSAVVSLSINENGKAKSIFLQDDTKVYDANHKRVEISALEKGQRIKATVSKTVFYDPVETYIECYKIIILQ